MKKLKLNQMETLQGGGFWSDLADGLTGACAVYNGAVLFKIIQNTHPILKGISYGCYAFLTGRTIAALA